MMKRIHSEAVQPHDDAPHVECWTRIELTRENHDYVIEIKWSLYNAPGDAVRVRMSDVPSPDPDMHEIEYLGDLWLPEDINIPSVEDALLAWVSKAVYRSDKALAEMVRDRNGLRRCGSARGPDFRSLTNRISKRLASFGKDLDTVNMAQLGDRSAMGYIHKGLAG